MSTCIYSRREFSKADAEHILQNSFGARFRSTEIVCDDVQSLFGETIDPEIAKPFDAIRMYLGVKSGRGKEPPILKGLKTTTGETVDILPGVIPRLSRPYVNVTEVEPGKKSIHIKLDKEKDLKWALKMLKEVDPHVALDASTLGGSGKRVRDRLNGMVVSDIAIGSIEYRRACVKACFNLLGVIRHSTAMMKAFDGVRHWVLTGDGNMGDYFRFVYEANASYVPNLSEGEHLLYIYVNGNKVDAYIRLFGYLEHSIRLSDVYEGASFTLSYVVNPFRDTTPSEIRNEDISVANPPSFDECTSRIDQRVMATNEKCFSRIMELCVNRENSKHLHSLANEIIRILEDSNPDCLGESNLSKEELISMIIKEAQTITNK